MHELIISGFTTKVDLGSVSGAQLVNLDLSGSALRSSAVLPPGLHREHLRLTAVREGRLGPAGVAALPVIDSGQGCIRGRSERR